MGGLHLFSTLKRVHFAGFYGGFMVVLCDFGDVDVFKTDPFGGLGIELKDYLILISLVKLL